jgi:SAM-dependent methyltransferase
MSPQLEAPAIPSREAVHKEVRRRVSAVYTAPPFGDVYRSEGDLLAWHDVLAIAQPPRIPGQMSRLKSAIKVKLARSLHWLFQRQVKFNRAVALHACESARVAAALDGNVLELFTTIKALERQVERLTERQRRSDALVAELQANLTVMRCRVARAKPPSDAASTLPNDVDEFALQNRLQGPREDVIGRLRAYLDHFRDAGKILDLCCGRGELVELLESEGIPVRGVDADPDMAEYCRERGLPVDQANAAEYLDEQVDGSPGGIFFGRSVERLTPAALVGLLRRCRTKLRTGGLLIVEALNPACPEALATFSADPARNRPLAANLLRFLLESEGFAVVETIVSGPVAEDLPPLARSIDGTPPCSAKYSTYAIVGRT